MKAAVFRSLGKPLTIENISLDTPKSHELIIKTAASGICHSDLHIVNGSLSCTLPAVLGHEVAGVVEKVGDQVSEFIPGDHVIACLSVFCGHCKQCLTGHPSCCSSKSEKRDIGDEPRLYQGNNPIFQFYNIGGFAEKILIHENSVVKINQDIPFDSAAILGCAVVTGLGAVFNTNKIEVGSTVAVFGCGGIGSSVIQAAKIAGAKTIIAVDIIDEKLSFATQLGATHTINSKKTDPADEIIRITGEGVDYSFECIGNKDVFEQAFYCLAPRGKMTLLGLYPQNKKIEMLGTAFYFERSILGSRMGSNRFRIDIPNYLELYQQKRLKLDEMITRRIKLDEINDAFEMMKSGNELRSVIMFEE